jgi:hypothetical protein
MLKKQKILPGRIITLSGASDGKALEREGITGVLAFRLTVTRRG